MSIIAIIGAGNIGSRHLQGLARLADAEIVVCDPSEDSLKLSQARWSEVSEGPLRAVSSIAELPEEIDVCIVATTANVRLEVMRRALEHSAIRAMILEKFLFQSGSEYRQASELLTGTGAWVNCPRRVWPVYRRIRQVLAGDAARSIRVTGFQQHRFGSNAIHFLDLAAFLCDRASWSVHVDHLEERAVAVKHQQTMEYSALLSATGGDDDLAMRFFPSEGGPLLIDIASDSCVVRIDESRNRLWWRGNDSGWEMREETFEPSFQSRLTGTVVQQLLDTGTCDLPGFDESARLHIAFMNAMWRAMGVDAPPEDRVLPVT